MKTHNIFTVYPSNSKVDEEVEQLQLRKAEVKYTGCLAKDRPSSTWACGVRGLDF